MKEFLNVKNLQILQMSDFSEKQFLILNQT